MAPRNGRRKLVQAWVFARSGAAAEQGQRQGRPAARNATAGHGQTGSDRSDDWGCARIEARPAVPRRSVHGVGQRQQAQGGAAQQRQLRCAGCDRRQRRGACGTAARHPERMGSGFRLGLIAMRGVLLLPRLDLSGERMPTVLASLGRCAVSRHAHHRRSVAHQRHRQQMQQHREGGQPDRGATGAEHGQRGAPMNEKTTRQDRRSQTPDRLAMRLWRGL